MMRYAVRSFCILLVIGCAPLKSHPPVVTSDVVVTNDVVLSVDTPVADVSDAAASDTSDIPAVDAADATVSDASDATVSDASDVTASDASDVVATDARDAALTDAPLTDAPLTDAPLTDAPLTDAPLTDAPLTDAPSSAWVPIAGGSCNARERNVATQESPHVDPDAGAIVYLTNPPASGPHYPVWARWGAWPDLPRGYWVHNLEHGGVVLLYNCASGACTATRDALVAASRTIPMDPACTPTDAEPASVRVVITNDTVITTPIAGAAWGWLYAADCVDPASIRSFYTRHAGMATENFCADGFYP
jgi:Protein of unknown function (DUF3105)